MSVFQRNRIGKGQLLQQQVLNPFILSRELDKISKNQRTVIKVQRTCNSKINEKKKRPDKSGLFMNRLSPDVHRHKNNGHDTRPLHIHPELSF